MKTITLTLAITFIAALAISAQTNVSGYILSNTTWTQANSPYIVTGNILVNNGVTLTIEPGVEVKFDTLRALQIDGELLAIGNAQNRITFTATSANPVRGSWGRIQFSPTSSDAVFDTAGNYISGSILKYCDILYGGGVPGDVTVYCDTAAPYFSNCRIEDCLKHAVYFVRAVGRVDSSSIRNCGGNAISYVTPLGLALIIKNDTIEDNAGGVIRSGVTPFSSVLIQDCIFTRTGQAVDVSANTGSVIQNNLFTSNTIALKGSLGINATISGNIFTGHTQGVIGNPSCYFYFPPYGGIPSHYNSATLGARNLTISGNHIENNKGAIYVGGEFSLDPVFINYALIEGNTFRNNQFIVANESCGSNNTNCSYYNSCLHQLIRIFNATGIFRNNTLDGNYTTQSVRNLFKINGIWEIHDNLIKNNAPGNISLNGKPTICNNTFRDNSGNVISSSGSNAGPYIHDNEFSNNSGGGTIISAINISDIRDNAFFNNTAPVISVTTGSTINNNEFYGNSAANAIVTIAGTPSTFSNNRLLNNMNTNHPLVEVSNSSSNIRNNEFLDNTGLSCLRVSGNAQPLVRDNNFINPNIQYEVENQIPFGPGANFTISNNYWGTTDTAHIDSVIKDYFDDANLSVALYPPVLTGSAFVDTTASCTSVICSLSVSGIAVNVSCHSGNNGSVNITVSNGTTPYTYVWSSGASAQNISNLTIGSYSVTVIDANFCSATRTFTISQPATPVAVVSGVVANANCNTGGSIHISAGGGTGPYTYNWGSGITTQNRTGLNTGNYAVTVRDNNNCSVTQSFTVGQDAGPVISGAVTNTSCHNSCDGIISLSATGAAPFSYDWGTGFGTSADSSALCAGTYNVTVADSNNCGIAASFVVASPAALSASAGITTNVSCFGFTDGAATASVVGGSPPYNFLWSDGQTTATASALAAGNYDVTVSDSLGCTASASVTIPDGVNVFVGAIGGTSSVEINQTSTYIVSAIFNYAYHWNVLNGNVLSGQGTNSIEVVWTTAGAGSVEVVAQSQGCADTVSKTVTVIDTTRNCSALFYLYPDAVPHTYFIISTASGIPQLLYSWNWGDGTPNDTAAYPTHTYSAPGFYTICLTITDAAGCTDTHCHPYYLLKTDDQSSAIIHVSVYPPSFTNLPPVDLENISLYPNPTSGIITLQGISQKGTEPLNIRLYDALGKIVWQYQPESIQLHHDIQIDLSSERAGVFFLNIHTGADNRVMKVVKY